MPLSLVPTQTNPFADAPTPQAGAPTASTASPTPSGGLSLTPVPGNPFGEGAPQAPLNWSDVPGKAVQNLLPSAVSDLGQMGSGIAQAVTNPVATAKSFYDIGNGLVSKLEDFTGIQKPDDQREALVNNLGSQIANRYGSLDAFKQTLANDPFGVAFDLSTVLSGGELAAAKIPGVVGDVARTAADVGRTINPVNAAVKGATNLASYPLAVTTGVAPATIRAAAAGDPALTAAMRAPDAAANDPVTLAQSAIQKAYAARGAAYNASTAGTFANQTPIRFNEINQAVQSVQKIGKSGSAGLIKDQEAVDTANKIDAAVQQWQTAAATDPYYATAAGVDDLKQAIGTIRADTKVGTRARSVADEVYNAAKGSIVKQNPGYANAMMGYSDATDSLRQIQKELSLGKSATTAQSFRKLMGTAVTGDKGRTQLVNDLAKYEPALPSVIAGQALSSWLPRGLSRIATGGVEAASLAHGINPATWPGMIGIAAASSPRLVGEGYNLVGGIGTPAITGANQFGRLVAPPQYAQP